MIIREAREADLAPLLETSREAFGEKEGPEIVELITNLLSDPTAQPLLSLVAVKDDQVVGHILFTSSQVSLSSDPVSVILAPLSVAPAFQRQGVGGKLIAEGLHLLSARGVGLVFVLGHPEYYPRHGFQTAGVLGFEAPYPILEKYTDAWMVQELSPGLIGTVKGKVSCAEMMDRPEYWTE